MRILLFDGRNIQLLIKPLGSGTLRERNGLNKNKLIDKFYRDQVQHVLIEGHYGLETFENSLSCDSWLADCIVYVLLNFNIIWTSWNFKSSFISTFWFEYKKKKNDECAKTWAEVGFLPSYCVTLFIQLVHVPEDNTSSSGRRQKPGGSLKIHHTSHLSSQVITLTALTMWQRDQAITLTSGD